MKKHRLTNRELDIIQILWKADHPLLASEIQKQKPQLNINTVQAALRKLTACEMVRVAELVQNGTVFGRTYEPVISYEQYILTEFRDMFPQDGKRRNALMAALIEDSIDTDATFHELEELIKKYREGLKR